MIVTITILISSPGPELSSDSNRQMREAQPTERKHQCGPGVAGHLYPMRTEKGTLSRLTRARSGNQAGSRATPSLSCLHESCFASCISHYD